MQIEFFAFKFPLKFIEFIHEAQITVVKFVFKKNFLS